MGDDEPLADAPKATAPWEEDGHSLTDFVVGPYHENHDGRRRGCYPAGMDPGDFVGQLRRFGAKTVQYLLVVGDLNGHAVYRMLNEGDGPALYSMPWDEFVDRTALVRPDAAGLRDQDDPARTVVRTDFGTLRSDRAAEVEAARPDP